MKMKICMLLKITYDNDNIYRYNVMESVCKYLKLEISMFTLTECNR